MQKPKKLPRDPNAFAARIVAMSTGQPVPNELSAMTGAQTGNPPILPETEKLDKNPAAVALGRLGGLKGGKARAAALSKKKRTEIARKGATTRWAKKKNPGAKG